LPSYFLKPLHSGQNGLALNGIFARENKGKKKLRSLEEFEDLDWRRKMLQDQLGISKSRKSSWKYELNLNKLAPEARAG
jgi:hypothetical protein